MYVQRVMLPVMAALGLVQRTVKFAKNGIIVTTVASVNVR